MGGVDRHPRSFGQTNSFCPYLSVQSRTPPIDPVMHDQKIHLLFSRSSNRPHVCIHRPPDLFDLPTMGHLQSVSRSRIVPETFSLENMITLPRQISWLPTRPLSLFHKRTLTPLSKHLHPPFIIASFPLPMPPFPAHTTTPTHKRNPISSSHRSPPKSFTP